MARMTVLTPKQQKTSLAKVAYHLQQLTKLFHRAAPEQFLQMIWAVDSLFAGRTDAAARVLAFPKGAVDQGINSPHAIHRWELETLVTQLFLSPKLEAHHPTTAFDCKKFESVAELVNRLRNLEDVESGAYLTGGEFNIFGEMHRIGQRQFHWQRGYFNLPQFYRYAFIYGQGKCGEYFEKTYGLPIAEFNFVGFALFVQSWRVPWIGRNLTVPELGLTNDLVKRSLPLMLQTLDNARVETKKVVDLMNEIHGRPIPTAFLPSVLRRFPLLSVGGNGDSFIAPIPEVLVMRVTSGLYYDLISGGQSLLNDANDRFEEYSAAYIGAMMKRFKIRRAYRYEPKQGAAFETPDLMIQDGDKIVLVVECKATKLTYLGQFAESPFEAEKKQYIQIANGVFQVWRFFSHVRRGLVKEPVDADTAAMVLTLDSFLTMGGELKAKVIEEATSLANKEGDIVAEDRRQVIFCPIDALEGVLSTSTEHSFLETLKAALREEYNGWQLREISRNEAAGKDKIEPKKFPFELGGLLPWWKRSKDYPAG
jgi:hypothetical protein